ncbi:MAG: hypothetical protein Q8Q09_11225 [Deltaproteobacteria bacterium]|nr:hypothetical protein [Deltaproteobacteria bacterium]
MKAPPHGRSTRAPRDDRYSPTPIFIRLTNCSRLWRIAALSLLAGCAPAAPIAVDVIEDRPVALRMDAGAEASTDAAVDAPVVETRAGAPCTEDATCGAGLRCERTLSAQGFCTAPCQPSRVPAMEAAQCGGGQSTCLQNDNGVTTPVARCARACNALGRRGDSGCREGFVCTGNAMTHPLGIPDAPGCQPFCRLDAHCPAGARCNPRTGRCGAGLDRTRLPDGALCMPVDPTGGAVTDGPCRGFCAWVGSAADTVGVCASLADEERNEGCQDDPLRVVPVKVPGDNMMACGPRDCSATDCCDAGLECRMFAAAAACLPVGVSREPLIACEATDGGREDSASDATADASGG